MAIERLPLKSAALLRRRRRRSLLFTAVTAVLIGVLTGFLSYVSHDPRLLIERTLVTGNAAVGTEDILGTVREHLAGKHLFAFPKRSVFFYPQTAIEETLLSRFPKLASANVGFYDFHTIEVRVEERNAVGVWCAGTPTASGDCYFLDATGYIFGEAPTFSGDAFFSYFGPVTGGPLRTSFLTQEEFNRTGLFLTLLKGEGLYPVALLASGTSTREMFFGAARGRIIFESTQEYAALAEGLAALLDSEVFKGFDRSVFALDYIDLRLGEKVFYKLQKE